MFTLFRFRIRTKMILNVVWIAFIMSQVSYITRLNPEIGDMSAVLQYFLITSTLWVLFRVPLFYSAIMVFSGFITGFVIQGITILTLTSTIGLTLETIRENIWIFVATQVLTAILTIAICRTLHIMNWTFDFVPTSHRANVKIHGTNAILLATIVLCIVLTAAAAYLFRNTFEDFVVYSLLVFVITLPIFYYYAVRKDNEDAS